MLRRHLSRGQKVLSLCTAADALRTQSFSLRPGTAHADADAGLHYTHTFLLTRGEVRISSPLQMNSGVLNVAHLST